MIFGASPRECPGRDPGRGPSHKRSSRSWHDRRVRGPARTPGRSPDLAQTPGTTPSAALPRAAVRGRSAPRASAWPRRTACPTASAPSMPRRWDLARRIVHMPCHTSRSTSSRVRSRSRSSWPGWASPGINVEDGGGPVEPLCARIAENQIGRTQPVRQCADGHVLARRRSWDRRSTGCSPSWRRASDGVFVPRAGPRRHDRDDRGGSAPPALTSPPLLPREGQRWASWPRSGWLA
jgi:hypothetical protein